MEDQDRLAEGTRVVLRARKGAKGSRGVIQGYNDKTGDYRVVVSGGSGEVLNLDLGHEFVVDDTPPPLELIEIRASEDLATTEFIDPADVKTIGKEHKPLTTDDIRSCLDPDFDVGQIKRVPIREGEDDAFLLYNYFSPEECQNLIAYTEAKGYGTTNYRPDYRGNTRLICDDSAITEVLFERIKPFLKEEEREFVYDHQFRNKRETYEATTCNNRLRFCRYTPGERFQRHCDGFVTLNDQSPTENLTGCYTMNAYLNTLPDDAGGTTGFYFDQSEGKPKETADTRVHPVRGLMVVFRQPSLGDKRIWHDGERVRKGVKYLFRTDLMFRRTKRESIPGSDWESDWSDEGDS